MTESATATDTTVTTQKEAVWFVTLYNDAKHTFLQVTTWLTECCEIPTDKAYLLACQVDREGRAQVYHGTKEKCNAICKFLRERGLQCEIDTTE